jgi:ribonuclease P protein component
MARPVVGAVRDRTTFRAFRHASGRARVGPLRVTYVSDPGVHDEVRVAYAVSRHCGKAVVRNRLRRRMRAVVRTLGDELPHGAYLISPAPTTVALDTAVLSDTLRRAMLHAAGRHGD